MQTPEYSVLAVYSVILCILFSGCAASAPAVAGTYTHTTATGDVHTLEIRPDGTYLDNSYSVTKSGTWTAENTVLKLDPSVMSWQEDKTCGNPVCPPKAVWVPGDTILSYTISADRLVDEHGIVWQRT